MADCAKEGKGQSQAVRTLENLLLSILNHHESDTESTLSRDVTDLIDAMIIPKDNDTLSISNHCWISIVTSVLWMTCCQPPPSKNRDSQHLTTFLVYLVQTWQTKVLARNDKDDQSETLLFELQQQLATVLPMSPVMESLLEALEQAFTKTSKDDATSRFVESWESWILQAKTLSKKVRLFNTQYYYKQNKYNLLSEESEGYTKFLQSLQAVLNNNNNNTTSITSATIHGLERIMGTFLLDPNRCLDLVLDVLVWQVMSNDTYNNANIKEEQEQVIPILQELLGSSLFAMEHAPAILAFKLEGCRPSSKSNNPPPQKQRYHKLLRLMVYLVQCDLLKICDMLEYVNDCIGQPLQEAYSAAMKHEKQRIQSLGKVRLNAASESETKTANDKEVKAQEHIQTLRLVVQDSIVFDWICAFFQIANQTDSTVEANVLDFIAGFETRKVNGEWSKLCTLFPQEIGAAICDCVQRQVDKYLKTIQSKTTNNNAKPNRVSKLPPWTKQSFEKEQASVEADDKMDVDTDKPTRTLDEVIVELSRLLDYTRESGCIQLRPILYSHLCRLIVAHLDTGINVSPVVLDFLRSFLLPSLSLFPSNPTMSQEIWAVLRTLPYQTRYSMYQSWLGKGLERAGLRDTAKPLWLVAGEIQAGKDARYALKRLSKDTIRDMSRSIAKVCHSHPLVVFTIILNQIESYDNLVQVMVDSFRFVTPLSLDVLSSCILNRLSGSGAGGGMVNRSRLKEDGVNVSQWLQSLESFTGAFYKQFPDISFQGILSYLMYRLKEGQVMELGVLRTLLKTSGGWAFADYAPAASLSAVQLLGRAGSTTLERETMSFGVVEDINLRASKEVRRILQSDDLGVSLLILLAQVRHQIVFGQTTGQPKPVKLVANLVDTCQVVMSILLEFLSNPVDNFPGEEARIKEAISVYAQSLPTLEDLCKLYQVDIASAWMLCRPLIQAAERNSPSSEGDTKMPDAEKDSLESFRISEESHTFLKELLPAPTLKVITTDLFEVFFTNSLYDVYCPEDVYTTEISRLEKASEKMSQGRLSPTPASMQRGASDQKGDDGEKERTLGVAKRLKSDLTKQRDHVASVRDKLKEKKSSYFVSETVSAKSASVFLSRCIYPRCMQSPDDAMYCAHFIRILHEEGTPGFSTLHLFNSIIVALTRSLFGLTEGEAANVSILLYEIWKIVSRWRYDESAFNTEVVGKPGSFMNKSVVLKSSATEATTEDSKDANETVEAVTFSEYQELYNQWHASIGAVALGCLKSSEYIHTRNCLVVLTRMVEVYPTRPGLANKLLKTLEPLQDESNVYADIRASAQAYGTQLLRARDDGVWKEESAQAVQARQRREKAAAAARQKQAEKQMEEIKLESQKITDELGEWDGDRRRSGGGERRGGDGAPPPPSSRGGTASGYDDRRGGGPTSGGRGGDGQRMNDDRWQRGGPPPPSSGGGGVGGSSYSAMGSGGPNSRTARGGAEEERWQRGGGGGGRKRSRPSSPIVEEGESDRRPAAKRSRTTTNESNRDGGDDAENVDGGGGRRRRRGGGGRR